MLKLSTNVFRLSPALALLTACLLATGCGGQPYVGPPPELPPGGDKAPSGLLRFDGQVAIEADGDEIHITGFKKRLSSQRSDKPVVAISGTEKTYKVYNCGEVTVESGATVHAYGCDNVIALTGSTVYVYGCEQLSARPYSTLHVFSCHSVTADKTAHLVQAQGIGALYEHVTRDLPDPPPGWPTAPAESGQSATKKESKKDESQQDDALKPGASKPDFRMK